MGRQSKKKAKAVTDLSNWFWDAFMAAPDGVVSIDDFSRKYTEIKYHKRMSTDEFMDELRKKAKDDKEVYEKLVHFARHGYMAKLMHNLVMPVRHFYEHEKDEQGNPSRLIYSVKRNGKQGWTFINLKDLDFWNQTAFRNMDMTDAYKENEKRLWEQAWEQLRFAKSDKERQVAMMAIESFRKRNRHYELEKE